MDRLSPSRTLELWERGHAQHPVDRALSLYAAACPQVPWPQLADASIGKRDAALFELRCATFGRRLDATAVCPQCGERLAFTLDLDALLQREPAAAAAPVEIEGERFRLPNSHDLASIAQEEDVDMAARRLLERCRVAPAADAQAWSEAALARIDAAIAAADPQADVALDLSCDDCGHAFSADFDIGAVLWQEIDACARRALLDVDALARAYGWSEGEILGLSEARRAHYVELAGR